MARTIFYTLCLFTILLFGLTLSVHAQDKTQDYEYGKFEDLKGLKTIYIDAHGNIKDRNEIIQEFEKAKLGLVVVDEKESAEIVIDFESSESYDRPPLNPLARVKIISGNAIVTIKGKSENKRRVVMNFDGGTRNPAEKFSKEFIKLYQKTFLTNNTKS